MSALGRSFSAVRTVGRSGAHRPHLSASPTSQALRRHACLPFAGRIAGEMPVPEICRRYRPCEVLRRSDCTCNPVTAVRRRACLCPPGTFLPRTPARNLIAVTAGLQLRSAQVCLCGSPQVAVDLVFRSPLSKAAERRKQTFEPDWRTRLARSQLK